MIKIIKKKKKEKENEKSEMDKEIEKQKSVLSVLIDFYQRDLTPLIETNIYFPSEVNCDKLSQIMDSVQHYYFTMSRDKKYPDSLIRSLIIAIKDCISFFYTRRNILLPSFLLI